MLDIFILLILTFGAYKGWRSGFLCQLVSLLGFVAGLVMAGLLYQSFGDYLAPRLGASQTLARILAFILLWIVVPVILMLIARILSRALESIHLGLPNSLGGVLVAVLKYALVLSFVFRFFSYTHIVSPQHQDQSRLYRPIERLSSRIYHAFDINRDHSEPLPADSSHPATP